MDLKKWLNNSKGYVIVGMALMVPVVMLCGSLVVDYGNWKAQETRLQNAADASVIAGAWHLDESDSSVYGIVENYVTTNTEGSNYNSRIRVEENTVPDSTGTLNVNMQTSESEITVTLLTRVPTTFLHYFGFAGLPVQVSATAQVSGGEEFTDEMFGFAMCAAHNTITSYNMRNSARNNESEEAIYIDTDGVDITGDIMTNGKIGFDQNSTTTLRGTVYADSDLLKTGEKFTEEYWQTINGESVYVTKTIEPSVWGTFSWGKNGGKQETFSFMDSNGNAFVQESEMTFSQDGWKKLASVTEYDRSDKVSYRDEIDISVDNNEGIKKYLESLKKMSVSERERQNIYYDDDTGHSFYQFNNVESATQFPALGLGDSYSIVTDNDTSVARWDRWYKTIVVANDIEITFDGCPEPTDDDFAVVISLNGNIRIPNDVNFNGILYAPNGQILINGRCNVGGSLVAQQIKITTPGQSVTTRNSVTHRSTSHRSTGKSIRLVG